jgi:hypothetical protein
MNGHSRKRVCERLVRVAGRIRYVSLVMVMATKEEVAAFVSTEFPQTKCVVHAVGNGGATVSHDVG